MNKYIAKIEWCPARHLSLATPMPDNLRVYLTDYMPYEELCIVGLASLEISDEIVSGVRVWTSKVVATLPERISAPDAAVSLRLTAVDGTQYIMGLSDRPHPVVAFDDKHPSSPSGQCACAISAVLKGPLPALIICSL